MKVLLTGGAGFIGSHLTEKLLRENHQVVVWDNLHTGRKKNIEKFFDFEGFHFFDYDIREPHDFAGDAIINLACPASPVHYQADPIYTWETSVLGVHHLLHNAELNQSIFLHASTSEVYGDPLEHPQSESYWGNVNPVGIRSCYDEGKRAAETLIRDFRRFKNLDTRLFRIFNTYGPNMLPDDGRVVSNFCVQTIENKPLTIYGDGKQTRSFAYVSDLVDGIVKILHAKREQMDIPINLGNPKEFTMLELAELLEKVSGKKIDRQFFDLPADDPQKRKPNIRRAKEVLDWQPIVSLEEGLTSTYRYFEDLLTSS